MKKIKHLPIAVLFVLANSCSCDPYKLNRKLFISNNSSSKIAVFTSKSYPDSVSYIFESCQAKDVAYLVDPKITRTYLHRVNWENEINQTANQGLLFVVYNADSVLKYDDNTLCTTLYKRKDLVLKRFNVTMDYLNRNDWKLSYP